MKLVVLVQCHRYTSTLEYTVKKLAKSKNISVFIHVDLKFQVDHFSRLKGKNVFFIENRVNIRWGHISQVNATINMMRAVRHIKYDYLSLISGDDLFVQDSKSFICFLHKNRDLEYIGVQKVGGDFLEPFDKIAYNYPAVFFKKETTRLLKVKKAILKKMFRFGCFKNKLYPTLPKLYKGSNWFTITKKSTDYILDYIDESPVYLNAFRFSLSGDEVFFQTILMNSPFRERIYKVENFVNDNVMSLRYIDWDSGPAYPKLLDESDFPSIKNSEAFFARKLSDSIKLSDLTLFFD